jgi:hypothetical protein
MSGRTRAPRRRKNRTFRDGRHSVAQGCCGNSNAIELYRNQDKEMQMRIGIGIAVVVAIGLIWSVAVMSEWVPVVSADAALGTRIFATHSFGGTPSFRD